MSIYRHTPNSRDEALELVEEGVVSAEQMLTMALKYMSTDDVADMLDCNELSSRFRDDEDYREFKKETAICVSPKTGRKFTKGWQGF